MKELFAPKFMDGKVPTVEEQDAMAAELGADSLFYLPLDAVARCIGLPAETALPGLPDRRVPDADRRAALPARAPQPRHRRRRRPHLRPARTSALVCGSNRPRAGPEIVDWPIDDW